MVVTSWTEEADLEGFSVMYVVLTTSSGALLRHGLKAAMRERPIELPLVDAEALLQLTRLPRRHV